MSNNSNFGRSQFFHQLLEEHKAVGITTSRHIDIEDAALVKAQGVLFAFAKCSEGITSLDPKYAATAKACEANGILLGAYHFGTSDDPVKQAELFVGSARKYGRPMLCLDFEPSATPSRQMSLVQADTFARRVNEMVGAYPILYTPKGLISGIGESEVVRARYPDLSRCPLWIATFTGSTPGSVPPPWNTWTFWHLGEDIRIKGAQQEIGGGVDGVQFNGTLQELRKLAGAYDQ